MHRGYNWGMRGLDTLGERITALRKPAGYKTQRALAVRLDVSDAFLSDIVRGVKNPSLEMLCELAGLLRTTTDYLLLRTDDPDVPGVRPLENGDPVYFSPIAAERAAVEQTRAAIAADKQRGTRQERLAELAASGPAMLTTPDTAAANAWLRRLVRVWVRDNTPVAVDLAW